MPKNSEPDYPEQWMSDVFGATKGEQAALDIWKRQHNLKVLKQRKEWFDYYGFAADEYPEWQTEENA